MVHVPGSLVPMAVGEVIFVMPIKFPLVNVALLGTLFSRNKYIEGLPADVLPPTAPVTNAFVVLLAVVVKPAVAPTM
jgi:hypothetical protein